jgi:hypothetical protein
MMEHPEKRERMGRLGHKQVSEEWNNETQVDRLIRFYDYILANRVSSSSSTGLLRS